jgi:hypothetical protein
MDVASVSGIVDRLCRVARRSAGSVLLVAPHSLVLLHGFLDIFVRWGPRWGSESVVRILCKGTIGDHVLVD